MHQQSCRPQLVTFVMLMLMQHARTEISADQGTAEQILDTCTANCVQMQNKQLLRGSGAKAILRAP